MPRQDDNQRPERQRVFWLERNPARGGVKVIEIGQPYKYFSCGHIFPVDTPTPRTSLPGYKLPSGNAKRLILCPLCQTIESAYAYRFKICPECGELRWAKRGNIQPGRCKVCGLKAYRPRKKQGEERMPGRYFQAGKEILQPRRPWTNPDCMYRDECLVAACVTHDSFLHCRGCEHVRMIEQDYTPVNKACAEVV